MRFFHSLPPFLRVVWVVGLLFPVASILLLLLFYPYWSPFHAPEADFARLGVITPYLSMLGMACAVVVNAFNLRVRQPGRRRRIPLDSWQSQAWALALAVAGPLCGFIVTLANAPNFIAIGTFDAFFVVFIVVVCWLTIVMGLLALL